MTFTTRSIPLLAAAVAMLVGGCYYQDCPVRYSGQARTAGYVEVDTAPPPVEGRVERRPPKPSGDAVWVAGHYDWRNGWVWVDGRWETPRPGHVWTPPVARRTPEGRIQYHPGHFRPADRQPPPVYRTAGDVRVSTTRPGHAAGTVSGGGSTSGPDVHTGGTVHGGSPETRRPDTTVDARGGTVHGGSPETRRPDTTVDARGGTVRGGSPETAAPRGTEVRGPGTETASPRGTGTVRGGTPATVELGCQLTVTRAPRGGHVTIRGTGFQPSVVVKVGGTMATVVRSDREHISFRVPRETGGGAVTVTVGNTSASCGHLSVTGR